MMFLCLSLNKQKQHKQQQPNQQPPITQSSKQTPTNKHNNKHKFTVEHYTQHQYTINSRRQERSNSKSLNCPRTVSRESTEMSNPRERTEVDHPVLEDDKQHSPQPQSQPQENRPADQDLQKQSQQSNNSVQQDVLNKGLEKFRPIKVGSFPFARNIARLIERGAAIVPIEHRTIRIHTSAPTSHIEITKFYTKEKGLNITVNSDKSYSKVFFIKANSTHTLEKVLEVQSREGDWGIESVDEMGSLGYQVVATATRDEKINIQSINRIIKRVTGDEPTIIQCNNTNEDAHRCIFFIAFKNTKFAHQLTQLETIEDERIHISFAKYSPLPTIKLCGKCLLPLDHNPTLCKLRCQWCGDQHHHSECNEGFNPNAPCINCGGKHNFRVVSCKIIKQAARQAQEKIDQEKPAQEQINERISEYQNPMITKKTKRWAQEWKRWRDLWKE